jgi:hypothetical protein
LHWYHQLLLIGSKQFHKKSHYSSPIERQKQADFHKKDETIFKKNEKKEN